MLVRIQKDWDFPNIRQQSSSNSCSWNDINFTFDPVEKCDLFIALNPPNKDVKIRCPFGNKWLFTGESPIEQYRWHIESFKYFDKVFTFWDDSVSENIIHDQTSLPWHIGRSYDELVQLSFNEALSHKTDAVSWVTSNASHKEGHKLRMSFKDFLVVNKFKFDLYGRGFNPIHDKFDGIFPYKYSIAIENYSCNDYWTEKIADCFLSWTVPIYWGAKNILSYFPEKSIILIDPNNHQYSLDRIKRSIGENYFYANIDAIAEARDLILNKYQLFPHVCDLIKKYDVRNTDNITKSFIPANTMHTGEITNYSRIKKFIKKILLP